jgi:hypothetical protein
MNQNNYKKDCSVVETVWRSSRLNESGDELVVASGVQSGKKGYFMAWEVTEDRGECISWNGKVSWYPRMFWEYIEPVDSILVEDDNEVLSQLVPGKKRYWIKKQDLMKESDEVFYIKVVPSSTNEEGKLIYRPHIKNNNLDALGRAIQYVQWFNENHRQLLKYDKLLSKSKKARKRRNKRLEKRLLNERSQVDNDTFLRA